MNDYNRRLNEHNESSRNTFTSKYRPWELKAVFEFEGIEAEAISIKRLIKKQKSSVFIPKTH